MTTNQLDLLTAPAVDLADPDVRALRDRIAKWQRLFSPGSETYSLSGYEDLYLQGPDALLVYDNYAERDTRWLGFDRYRRIWEREINENFPGFVMYRIELDRAEAVGDLAWTAFTWFGRMIGDGGPAWPTQHATHIWRRSGGQWRIAHEHLTSGVKESGAELAGERRTAPFPNGSVHRHSRDTRRDGKQALALQG